MTQPTNTTSGAAEQAAYDLGANGAPATDAERLLFEAWMRGHCWALCATWDGKSYRSDAEQGGDLDPRAMNTRQLWAAWRVRAALESAAAPQPSPSPAPVHPGQEEGEREAFIRWYMEYLHTDEMLAAYVWDNEHIVPQTWRAARTPADSVLEDTARESEYRRGYRHGYEQRDAEVRGALA